MKLSPIVGYLLAGYLIGPFSPGFVADLKISEQLAEIGVILMMFGVGLHFKWQDLLSTRHIAIPGAIVQTGTATVMGALAAYLAGWQLEAGIVMGFAVGVASTVVLVRMLTDNHLLNTLQGHIAVGWLIVEDVITVVLLLMLPVMASMKVDGGSVNIQALLLTFSWVLIKFVALLLLMFTLGRKIVVAVFTKISQTQSHELFTLATLALTFSIATGAALIFGVSIALGAFIAGMIIGQTNVQRRVANNSMPMQDAFVVIFFLSVGMLFNPGAILEHFYLFIIILTIIIIVKPLTAFIIMIAFKQPMRTALVVSFALAQIGEFSFILTEEAMKAHLMPEDGFDIIVACAIVSISLNPLLFKLLPKLEKTVKVKK
jgi:CPA2 family monovalent cation:H+ antiporter-2